MISTKVVYTGTGSGTVVDKIKNKTEKVTHPCILILIDLTKCYFLH